MSSESTLAVVEAQRDAWLLKSLQSEEKLQKAIEERDEARGLLARLETADEVASSLAKAVADRDVLQQNLDAATKIINELNDSVQSVVAERDKAISERDAHVERSIELATELESLRSSAPSPWVVFGVEPTIVSGAMLFETPLWFLEIATRGEFTFKVKTTDTVFNHKFDRVHLLDGPEWFEGAVRAFLRVHRARFAEVFKSVQGDNIRIGND